jgi:hypothetical protein
MEGVTGLRHVAGGGAAFALIVLLLLCGTTTASARLAGVHAHAAAGTLDAALAADLAAGTRARALPMLRHGRVRVPVQAPESGELTIEWAAPLARAHAGKLGPPATVYARGTLDFTAPGRGMLPVSLTHLGWVLLAHVRRPRLATWVTFAIPGQGVQAMAENFVVRR